jgi:hypothetical protein
MPSTWDPRELLDCDPLGCFTCVGVTLKGQRCRNSVNASDCIDASGLLDRMSQKAPRDVGLAELETLAELTLCLRWHRYHPRHGQVEEVSRDWLKTIRNEYPARAIRDPSPRPRTRIVAVETISVSAAQSRSATARRPAVALITPPPSPPPSRRRSASPSPTGSRPQTPAPTVDSTHQTSLPSPQSTPAIRSVEPVQPRAAPVVESPPSPPRTPSPAPAVQRQNTTQPDPPSASPPAETEHHHSRRRPITDPCPICTSEICCEDDAVWCRAQCGQSIHRGCFAAWRTECLARAEQDTRARVTCVYW